MSHQSALRVACMAVMLLSASALHAQPVSTGADILLRDSLHVLAGKRVGLVSNRASVLSDGTTLLDRLRASSSVEIRAIFGPEHGFSGAASAGELIPGGRIDSIPVYSLFGTVRKPTPAMLAGLDVLIFDLQDIGVRYYTYMSTLALCIEATAEAGIELLVLDRPNPLGGDIVEGPIRADSMRSFVAMLPIPVRHGMTTGELARMMVGEGWLRGGPHSSIRVIPMDGWHRSMYFDDTGMKWIPPSPNIPSVDAALAYVGTCLFEGTAVSEGRGSDSPFLRIGAPFINGKALTESLTMLALPGVRFRAVEFTPASKKGARNPKYAGRRCHGIDIEIIDRSRFRSFDCGIQILRLLHGMYGEKMGFTLYLDTLAGIQGFANRCLRGHGDPNLCDWSDHVAHFKIQRTRYLLYR